MTILLGCEFWGVDKVKLLQTSVNDHWHGILRRFQHPGGSLEDIDLDSGQYVPVGHNWKFDLEQCLVLILA